MLDEIKFKTEIKNLMEDLTAHSSKYYFSFLDTMAKFHKYPLFQQAGLHMSSSKNSSAYATAEQWKKFFNRDIKPDAHSIEILESENTNKSRVLYDIKDTYANNEEYKQPQVWKYDHEKDKQIFDGDRKSVV